MNDNGQGRASRHRERTPYTSWTLACAFFALPWICHGDVIYSLDADLLQTRDGQVTQLPTGKTQHKFVTLSDDSRFVLFSAADPTSGTTIVPSADIYRYDRTTDSTERLVDHTSGLGYFYEPTTASLSPNNQLVAYGVGLYSGVGQSGGGRGVTLAVARAGDGVITDEPLGPNPISDAFFAAFVGLDWDPGGNSFVTTSYVPVTGANLPAIVRFTRSTGGNWSQTALTTPFYSNSFPAFGRTYIYPALSPSGAGLAFFSLYWPDMISGSQPITASLIVANSDGSNATLLTTFAAGKYPAGLSWSRDGTKLIFSIADQEITRPFFTGYLPGAQLDTAVVRSIDIQSRVISPIDGISSGAFAVAADNLDGSSSGGPVPVPMLPPVGMALGFLALAGLGHVAARRARRQP